MLKDLKKLISLGAIYSLGPILPRSLKFFFIPIYVHYLSSADYGLLGLMTAAIWFLSFLIYGPISNGFSRFYYYPEFKTKKDILLFNCVIATLLKSFLFSFILFVFRNAVASAVLGNIEHANIVVVFCFVLIFHPLARLGLALLRLQQRAKYFIFSNIFSIITTAILILYLLIAQKLGVKALIYGELFRVVILVIALTPALIKSSKFVFYPAILKEPFSFGYGGMLSGLSAQIIAFGDRYIIRLFRTLSEVGLYSFAYNFSFVTNVLLVTPVKQALYPLVFNKEDNPDEIRQFVKKVGTLFYLFAISVFLFFSLFCKDLIVLLASKEEFHQAWVVVPVLAFCAVQSAMGHIMSLGIVMAKKGLLQSVITVLSAFLNIICNLILVPYFGIMGAALGTMISYIFWNALRLHYSAKYFNLHFELKRLGKITLIGLGLYAISFFIVSSSIFVNIIIKLSIFLAYPIIIFLTGFFDDEERGYIKIIWTNLKRIGTFRGHGKLMEKFRAQPCEEDSA